MHCLLNYILLSFKVKSILKIPILPICLYLPYPLAQDPAHGGAQLKLTKQNESGESLWGYLPFSKNCIRSGGTEIVKGPVLKKVKDINLKE